MPGGLRLNPNPLGLYCLPHASVLQSDVMDHGSEIMDCETGSKEPHEKEAAATEAVGTVL